MVDSRAAKIIETRVVKFKSKVESFVRELPDPEGACIFYERLTEDHPRAARLFERDEGLLGDTLALAAWSPLLATTLAQNPDYLTWLARERALARVRTTEELGESLARFALTHSQISPQILLARFRRRELLRTYLHDIRRTSTLVETTEELSNLADAVLQYALNLAQQELENLYGLPQHRDERERTGAAHLCIVALGKLGSRELNYASDIDLLFLYSDDGMTSGKGARDAISNREYFGKLAERVARIVGQPTGEGAAYRVDLRLRPHGRDGALSCSLAEALRYYHGAAQRWELQALIRARAAAGSTALYTSFAEGVRGQVYRVGETVAHALAHVRLAKQKIDRHHEGNARGYNVKLGRGGIREIEFIAQALQLAHGGRDSWLHAPHTLISLGRLADRALITERERTELSDAYVFLRTLEHRLQMEHGLQTHSVPDDVGRRAQVARRMNLQDTDALGAFDHALRTHTAQVRAAYDRVFAGALDEDKSAEASGQVESYAEASNKALTSTHQEPREHSPGVENSIFVVEREHSEKNVPVDTETAAITVAANVFAPRLSAHRDGAATGIESIAYLLRDTARATPNARRALTLTARIAASLDKSAVSIELSEASVAALVRLCAASEHFAEMLAGNPALIPALLTSPSTIATRDHRAILRASVDGEKSFGSELAALRRTWASLLVEVGTNDAAGAITMHESNRLQTELAAASLNAGYLIARRELARRYGELKAGPRLTVLGLGRLGSGGTDYGSDLDIVLVFDPAVPSPIATLTREESYARLSEILVVALSSLTRDGYLYRVDMRLRPDGNNGPAVIGAQSFIHYLRERASAWEWLAYVKLRAVAGDLELGRVVEREARHVIHAAAQEAKHEVLRSETRRVRERLERERTPRTSSRTIDIKYAAGGMLDVYFAARYLQLRDQIPDDADDRSTAATLARLRDAHSLSDEEHAVLDQGYALLRTLDHKLRLLAGRATRLPVAEDHPLLRDLAHSAGYSSAVELSGELTARMRDIRAAYERITAP